MSISKDFVEIINSANKKGPQPYTTTAKVVRVDGQTAYVHLKDGAPETPVSMSIAAKEGDDVLIRIASNGGYIIGNTTSPPTDDEAANGARIVADNAYETALDAENKAAEAQSGVDEINESIDAGELTVDRVVIEYCLSTSNAEFIPYDDMEWSEELPEFVSGCFYWARTATCYEDDETVKYSDPIFSQTEQLTAETKIALDSTNNHFWHDNTGAYVTEDDGTYNTGYATRITNAGILQSYNGLLMSSWTNSGVTFYKSDGQTALASYGSNGISFASDVPFTIGNNTSYIKWVKENNIWKIKICADSIEMGGSSVMVDGDAGKWYSGTGITGTSTTATIFSGSGVANAKVGDMYLNTSTSRTYRCTVAGAPSVARWVYVNSIKGADGQDGQDGADGIDVTSQYMAFDSTNGLRVYSGSRYNQSYNKTFVQIKGTDFNFFSNNNSILTIAPWDAGGSIQAVYDTNKYALVGVERGYSDEYVDIRSVCGNSETWIEMRSTTSADVENTHITLGANKGNQKGTINLLGNIWADAEFWNSGHSTTTSGANARLGSSNDKYGLLMRSTSSSRRYKSDIETLSDPKLDPERLYELRAVQYLYRPDYVEDDDQRAASLVPGFIAEEVAEVYPIAADLDGDGGAEDWNFRYIIPPMLALIQQHKRDIDELKERITQLTA